jgi:hypothetical protein
VQRRFSSLALTFAILFLTLAPVWPTLAEATSLRLKWQDSSTNETGFKVERMVGSNYAEIGSVGANVESYTDSGLSIGSTYCYRVRAFNSAGVSASSNSACATVTSTSGSDVTTSPSTSTSTTTNTSTSSSQTSSAWSNYSLTMKIRSNDDDAIGVMFRLKDNDNYYRFSWYAQEKTRRLEKKVNGKFQVLARDTVVYKKGQTYTLQTIAQGSSLKVLIDGKTIFSVTDTAITSGTIAPYSHYNAGSYFDDILVKDLSTGSILLSANFNDGSTQGWSFVDESNESGPARWIVSNGALVQTSNAGSTDANDLGTYALYTKGSTSVTQLTNNTSTTTTTTNSTTQTSTSSSSGTTSPSTSTDTTTDTSTSTSSQTIASQSASTWNNYRATMKIRSNDDDALGVMFRFKDNDNYYRFSWYAQEKSRRLEKKVNGKFQVLAQDTVVYKKGQTYTLQTIAQGSSLKVLIDGKIIFSVTDTSIASGTIALYSHYNAGSYFDDILVEDLSTGSVLLSDNFNDGSTQGWTFMDESNEEGPARWLVSNGALAQTSNAGSTDANDLGTYALHTPGN